MTERPDPESRGDDTRARSPTRARILQAAAQIFAEQGYARATTRALAEAAGVNEVTLFRHFGSKENLFAAIIDEYAASALTGAFEARLTGDYRQDLMMMGSHVMEALMERRDAMRLMLCEAEHFPEVGEVLARNPRQLRRALAGYLQGQIDKGRVRRGHAEAMAQAFWGMFFAYAVSLGWLAEPVRPELSMEALVAQFVDIFVRGTMEAQSQPAP
jgi:AcrR family transcriptional regulator